MPSLEALVASPPRGRRRRHPPRRAGPGRGRTLVPSPVAGARRGARHRGAAPRRAPRTPASSTRLRELAPDACPVVAYGGLIPPRRARRAGRTAGSTCTSRCCPPGAAPRRCSTRSWPATTSPAPRRSSIEEGLDTGPVVRRDDRDDPAHRHRRRPARRLATAGAGLLVATLDGLRDGTLAGGAAAGRGRLARAQDHRRGRAGRAGTGPRSPSTGRSAAAPPRPGAWTTFRGERLKLAAGDRPPPTGPPPRRPARSLRVTKRVRPRRHRHRRRSGSATCSRTARSRWPRPTGPAASGIEAGERLGDD